MRRTIPTLRTVLMAVVVAVPLSAAGCSDDAARDPAPAPTPAVVPRPQSTAELGILTPSSGDVVDPGAVPLRISLEGAQLVEGASTDIEPDEGHLHVLLDGELVDMTSGLRGRLPDVEPGRHVLRVEFVAADHAPFDPRVVADVVFESR
jgi:hypothetical protein